MPEDFDAWLEVMTAARWTPGMEPSLFARQMILAFIDQWWPDDDADLPIDQRHGPTS